MYNGHPQGSVLANIFFSLYVAYMRLTKSRNFEYANDWILTISHNEESDPVQHKWQYLTFISRTRQPTENYDCSLLETVQAK